jgi:hypothetical protein
MTYLPSISGRLRRHGKWRIDWFLSLFYAKHLEEIYEITRKYLIGFGYWLLVKCFPMSFFAWTFPVIDR